MQAHSCSFSSTSGLGFKRKGDFQWAKGLLGRGAVQQRFGAGLLRWPFKPSLGLAGWGG